MKFKTFWMATAFVAFGWANSANAIVSLADTFTTDISWSATCFDCRPETQETSPASAIVTVQGLIDPETDPEFPDFAGNEQIMGLSYISELFEFTSISIDESVFLTLYAPVPTNGDSIISGIASFTLFQGEAVDGIRIASFLLDTLDDGNWELEVNEILSDFGDSALFAGATVNSITVPEPAGFAILGLGLLGLATIRLRRRAA